MSSADIENALRPLMQFVPAIVECKRIVAAAESARSELPELAKSRAKLEGDITDLEKRKLDCEASAREAKMFLNKIVEDSKIKQEHLRQESKILAEVCEQKRAEIAGLDDLFAERKKAKELEVKVLQDRADAMRAEIDRLRKQFAAA
jgi:DNA repair exonuclease SbcCD ATPase subunit